MNYEQGLKHAVPPEKKRIFIYNTAHHPTDITRCERESVCACVEEGGGGGGGGRRGIARSLNQSNHKIVKFRPLTS